jgi:hypothetical protein
VKIWRAMLNNINCRASQLPSAWFALGIETGECYRS